VAPTPSTTIDADRDVVAGFAELQAPLIGPDQAIPGVRSLDLTAAVRVESYSDFGRTAVPKVGLVWSPTEGVGVRATYGESFRAPALQELRSPPLNSPAMFPLGAGTLLSLLLQGGNPTLRPETATSWTVGADVRPPAIPELHVSATWFHTNFHDRIDQPVRQNLAGALTDPTLASFVRRISPSTSTSDLALITALLADPATSTAQGVFPATSYGAIVDVRFVNTSRLVVSGLDLDGDWSHGLAGGRLRLSAQATYLTDYEQQATPTAAAVERVGVAGFPARYRGRAMADWSRGPLGLLLALNETGPFKTPAGPHVDAFTSVDAQVRLTGAPGSRWQGASAALSIRNLFDTHPPFYDNPFGFAFDGANADVIGRFVSLRLTKDW
jgi:outer membrane receptor protein involved in Fe transport